MKSLGWNWIYNHITCTDNVSEWRRDKSNGIWFSGVLLVHFLDEPPHLLLQPLPHPSLLLHTNIRLRVCVCVCLLRPDWVLCSRKWQLLVHDHLFTRPRPPAALRPAHIDPVSISQPQPLFSLGGLRHTTGGCKTCLWGLLTVPSLRQLARMDWPSLSRRAVLSLTGSCPNGFTVSVSLIVSFFCLCVSPVQDLLSWMSSLCPAAFCSLHLLIPLGRMLLWLYLRSDETQRVDQNGTI